MTSLGTHEHSIMRREMIAHAIQPAIGNGVRRLDDGLLGTMSLMLGDEYLGHLLDCPLPDDGPWSLVGVADVELAQVAHRMVEERVVNQPDAQRREDAWTFLRADLHGMIESDAHIHRPATVSVGGGR